VEKPQCSVSTAGEDRFWKLPVARLGTRARPPEPTGSSSTIEPVTANGRCHGRERARPPNPLPKLTPGGGGFGASATTPIAPEGAMPQARRTDTNAVCLLSRLAAYLRPGL